MTVSLSLRFLSTILSLAIQTSLSSFLVPWLTYSEMLHVILALYQNQPLSMEFSAMKRVLTDDLDLKKLPEGFKLKAKQVESLA